VTRTGPSARRALPLIAAVAGVVLAHALDYALVFPGGAERARQLDATGHGYWPVAVAVAILAAVTALALAVRRGALGAIAPVVDPPSFSVAARRLAAYQVALFTVAEVVERLPVGMAPAPLVTSPAFLVGLAVQVVVAVAVLAVLGVVERATTRIVARHRRHVPAAALPIVAPASATPRPTVWVVAAGPRGPPLALA